MVNKKGAKRIFFIDDEHSICQLMCLFLSRDGHFVEVAYDGQQGIDILKDNVFDIVFTDIHMPKVSGNDVAKYMRKSPWLSNIPIVAVTGYVDEVERRLFDSVLIKPFNLKDLEQLIEKY